ncbi:MAG TPA: FG-GAP-like repeat-containing protein [Candidatus Binatia bacterium]|nr:FG-GAP-like repeat-containing protein [Candidatus Binatia bacterium]
MLQRVRGASKRTHRRMQRAAALMLAAAGMVAGVSPARPAHAAAVQTFMHQFPLGLTNTGTDPSYAVVDIDGDGDLDVFIGGFDGRMVYFENTGTATAPAFAAPRFNPFGFDTTNNNRTHPTFVDIDGDGDFDAFVGGDLPGVYFYENTGSRTSPAFAAPNAANPFGIGTTTTGSVPTFVDIDGDGDFDLFVGELFQVTYFKNTGSSTAPAFASGVGNPFGLIPNGVMSAVGPVKPSFADLDGDGDLDAFIYWNNGFDRFYYPNTGSSTAPAFAFNATMMDPFGLVYIGGELPPVFADMDGDGDLDAIQGTSYGNTVYYRNSGNSAAPAFAVSFANPFGIGNLGYSTNPAFADIDGDGDADAFVGRAGGDIVYLKNTGSSVAAAFAASVSNPFGITSVYSGGLGSSSPVFVDIDGDGDLDLFVGGYNDIFYFKNTGTSAAATFSASTAHPFGLTSPGLFLKPAFVDIDGDGDLDAFIGSDNSVFYYQNTGSSTAPAFAASVKNPFGLTDVLHQNHPTFVDIDGDGDLDAFIGDLYGNTTFFRNTGSQTAPAFAPGIKNALGFGGSAGTTVFVDIDGDGDPDAFSGEGRGATIFFENRGCGNARVETGEECDDGNGVDNDGCNNLCQTPMGDADLDGVINSVENAGPNGGDGNGDGKPDSTQANVTSLPSSSPGASYLTVVTDPSCPLENVVAMPMAPAGLALPFGGLGFRLPGCSSSRITIYYHGSDGFSFPPYRYFKEGANPPGAGNDVIYPLSFGAPHFAVLGTASLPFDPAVGVASFTLTDGVVGDSTIADGTIVDPGGPGYPAQPKSAAPVASFPGLLGMIGGLFGLARHRLRRKSPR